MVSKEFKIVLAVNVGKKNQWVVGDLGLNCAREDSPREVNLEIGTLKVTPKAMNTFRSMVCVMLDSIYQIFNFYGILGIKNFLNILHVFMQ